LLGFIGSYGEMNEAKIAMKMNDAIMINPIRVSTYSIPFLGESFLSPDAMNLEMDRFGVYFTSSISNPRIYRDVDYVDGKAY
jgi:hypothetical protein